MGRYNDKYGSADDRAKNAVAAAASGPNGDRFCFYSNRIKQITGSKSFQECFEFLLDCGSGRTSLGSFSPSVGLVCGAFTLLGLLTRAAVVPLFGIIVAAIFNLKLNELAGLNLSVLQEMGMIALLAGLCVTGGGFVSLDRFIFKHNRI